MPPEELMRPQVIGLIDAGFIGPSGASLLHKPLNEVKFEGDELIAWLQIASARMDMRFLRAYWYDGSHKPGTPEVHHQRKRFEELEACAGLQLRLGHLEPRPFDHKNALRAAATEMGIDYAELMNHFHPEKMYQQKGVDTLLVLDMIRLVQQGACKTLILMAGDRDLAEAVRVVQQMGATVILAYPRNAPVSMELRDLADQRIVWSEKLVNQLTSRDEDRFAKLYGTNREDEPL